MFRSFWRRRRTWFVLAGLGLLVAMVTCFPVPDGPLSEGLDPQEIRVGLGIFACIAFLWMTEAMPLAATAMLVPMLAVLLRVADVRTALSSFSHPLIFLFFGGFALASAMSYQQVDRWIARSLIRLGGGRFLPVAVLMFTAAGFLSMWMSNTATTAMMVPLALGVLGLVSRGENDLRDRHFLLLGVAYSASIGGLGTVIGSPPNGIAAAALGIGFTEWLRFGVPAVLVLMPVLFGLLFLVFRPTRGMRVKVEAEPFLFNRQRRMTLLVFGGAALCWIFGGWLGPLLGVSTSFDTLVALGAFLALVFFRLVRWRDVERGTDWGVLLLFGGGIALSGVLRDTGASLFLARGLVAMCADWPLPLLIGAVVVFVIFLTELSSNTAVAALFVPIFLSVAAEGGMEPAKLVAPLALAASCAFMLPVATPPNAIVFGTGGVAQRVMMRAGLVLNLSMAVLITLLSMALF